MDWLSRVPPWESQYSAKTHTDAEDCVAESLCHIIYMLTGRRYSPRALAFLSNTTPTGNYTDVVLAAANNFGLIPYDLWPSPDTFTWESYYSVVPLDVLALAEKLDIHLLPSDLNISPLWTEIDWGAGTRFQQSHMVAQVDDMQYFDSEQGYPIKPLNYLGATVSWNMSVQVPTAGLLMAKLLTQAAVLIDRRLSVDQWAYYWTQILGNPVDGGLLIKSFPSITYSDRLNLNAAEFAAAVTLV